MKERIKAKGYNTEASKIIKTSFGSIEKAAEIYGFSTRQLFRILAKPSADEEKKRMMCIKTPGLTLEKMHNISNFKK